MPKKPLTLTERRKKYDALRAEGLKRLARRETFHNDLKRYFSTDDSLQSNQSSDDKTRTFFANNPANIQCKKEETEESAPQKTEMTEAERKKLMEETKDLRRWLKKKGRK
ncbi:MAG: hypothetical protein WC471_03085 [Candidatus Woesearchaeota archaeon]